MSIVQNDGIMKVPLVYLITSWQIAICQFLYYIFLLTNLLTEYEANMYHPAAFHYNNWDAL